MYACGRVTKICKHMTINLVLGHATLSSTPVLQRCEKNVGCSAFFSSIPLLLETAGSGNKAPTHMTALSLLLPVLEVKNISYLICMLGFVPVSVFLLPL